MKFVETNNLKEGMIIVKPIFRGRNLPEDPKLLNITVIKAVDHEVEEIVLK